MKKNYKTKSMRLLVTLSLIVCLLVGCGNSKAETQPEVATDETPTVEEATEKVKEEPTAEPETKEEDEAVVEETTSEDETVAEETTEEETDSADPGEVTYITDFTSIDDYIASLDSSIPAIIIYNEQEGYIINMQEGQHYQLKSEDQILYNLKEDESLVGMSVPIDLGDGFNVFPNYMKFIVNYSVWTGEEKLYFYKHEDGSDKKIGIIACYLTPPTE